MCDHFLLGNVIRLNASFYNSSNVLASPTTVSLKVKLPDSTIVTLTPTEDSAGVFHYNYFPLIAGMYYYTYTGTGSINSLTQNQFMMVAPSV